MYNLHLTEEELVLFEQFLDSLKLLTKKKLADKGYTIFLPSFEIVYQNVVEVVNELIENTYLDEDLKSLFSFALHCSKTLTSRNDIESNIHAMSVDIYRCMGGKI